MTDKNERLTCTPHSNQEYEMVQLLADLSGNTLSYIVGQALHDKFLDEAPAR